MESMDVVISLSLSLFITLAACISFVKNSPLSLAGALAGVWTGTIMALLFPLLPAAKIFSASEAGVAVSLAGSGWVIVWLPAAIFLGTFFYRLPMRIGELALLLAAFIAAYALIAQINFFHYAQLTIFFNLLLLAAIFPVMLVLGWLIRLYRRAVIALGYRATDKGHPGLCG